MERLLKGSTSKGKQACRISTSYTTLPTIVTTFDVRFIAQNKSSYGIHMKENLKNFILMCLKIIATSHYTIKSRSFDYHINIKLCFSVM